MKMIRKRANDPFIFWSKHSSFPCLKSPFKKSHAGSPLSLFVKFSICGKYLASWSQTTHRHTNTLANNQKRLI